MQLASNKPPSNEGHGYDSIYPGTSQKVAFDASAQSTAMQSRTSIVRLYATNDCHIKVGKAADNSGAGPTAVADGTCYFLPKLVQVTIGVAPSSIIAAIKDTAGGNLFITEGA
jgi:hypothetical protein